MINKASCVLPLVWQLCGLYAYTMDALVGQATIYYQQPVRVGSPTELTLDKVEQLQSTQSLKLIVHGFLGSHTHSSIRPLANAYKAQDFDNILIADWEAAAGLDYASSRYAVTKVAMHFAKLLQEFLDRHGVANEAVHLIGHSLGAHIAGLIGNYFNGTLGRITGLDPALPLFAPHSNDSLQRNAARFVDVVHTDFPVFGDLSPRGTVDFYPNFGWAPQPGCADVDIIAASKLILEAYSCSHNRAVLLFAESVGLPMNFPAIQCTWKGIRSRNVAGCMQMMSALELNNTEIEAAIGEVENGQFVYMGEQVSRSASSYYFFETHGSPPFGQGAHAKFQGDVIIGK